MSVSSVPVAQRRAFGLILTAFGTFGLMYGVWQVALVDLTRALALTPGPLGAALSFGSLASLPVMLLGGGLADRSGARPVLVGAASALGLSLLGIALTHTLAPLLVWLLLFSGGGGLYDVALNALSVRYEQQVRPGALPYFHAGFSGFAALGALLSGALLAAGVPFRALYLGVAAVLFLLALVSLRSTSLPEPTLEERTQARPAASSGWRRFLPVGVVLLLSVLAGLTFFNEGSLETWAALYLRDALGVSVFVGAFGVMAVHTAMLVGRLIAARWVPRVGRRAWLLGAGVAGAVGLGLALVTTEPWLAVTGFLLAGLSYAGVLPSVFSLAGEVAGRRVGEVTATITTLGYLGFLVGPGLIGGVAQGSSLRLALGLLAVASVLIALLSRRVRLPG